MEDSQASEHDRVSTAPHPENAQLPFRFGVSQIVDDLYERRERLGFSCIGLNARAAEAFAPVAAGGFTW